MTLLDAHSEFTFVIKQFVGGSATATATLMLVCLKKAD